MSSTLLPTFLLYHGVKVLPFVLPEYAHMLFLENAEDTESLMKTSSKLLEKLPTSYFEFSHKQK